MRVIFRTYVFFLLFSFFALTPGCGLGGDIHCEKKTKQLVTTGSEVSLKETISIDMSQTQKKYLDLLGVNKPPTFTDSSSGTSNSFDIGFMYRHFGVSEVRLHDSGIDLCKLYKGATAYQKHADGGTTVVQNCVYGGSLQPDVVWNITNLDTNNPSLYDLSSFHEVLMTLKKYQLKAYLRLGESYNGPSDTNDTKAWASIAKNVMLYAFDSFGTTHGIGVEVTGVEIFNEPDGMFWQGSTSDFFELFRETQTQTHQALASKSITGIPIGGAGFTHNFPDYLSSFATDGLGAGDNAVLSGSFLSSVDSSKLDFLSFHYYDECTKTTPQNFISWYESIVNNLSASGKTMDFHLTEWNMGLGAKCGEESYQEQKSQSFVASVLLLMQESNIHIKRAHFYAGAPGMGLFGFDTSTKQTKVTIHPSAWSFWAHAKLKGKTKVQTQVCLLNTCSSSYDYAKSGGKLLAITVKDANQMTILVVNDDANTKSYDIHLTNLDSSWGSVMQMKVATPSDLYTGSQDFTDFAKTLMASGVLHHVPKESMVKSLIAAVPTSASTIVVSGSTINESLSIPAHSVQVITLTPY